MTSQTIMTPSLIIRPDNINNLKIDTNIDLHTIVSLQRALFHKKL